MTARLGHVPVEWARDGAGSNSQTLQCRTAKMRRTKYCECGHESVSIAFTPNIKECHAAAAN